MDTTRTARIAGRLRKRVSALPSGILILAIVAALTAGCWFVAVAPALASFALAVATAVTWSLTSSRP